MKIFKTESDQYLDVKTKNGKYILKLFDPTAFEMTFFSLPDKKTADVFHDYLDNEISLNFVYFRDFRTGWGSLVSVSDDSGNIVFSEV